jgi:hypothetical protein
MDRENALFCCFSKVHYVKIVPQPDIDAVFANNYHFQIIEAGSLSAFLPLKGWGSPSICLKISA